MYKMWITIIFSLLVSLSTCLANPIESDIIATPKPSIAVLYMDNTNFYAPSTRQRNKVHLIGDMIEKFSPRYNIYLDEKRADIMNAAGLQDLSSIERRDILSFFEDDTDYIIAMTALPHSASSDIYVHLKIIDKKNDKYLFSGILSIHRSMGLGGSLHREIHRQLDTQMSKLFPLS